MKEIEATEQIRLMLWIRGACRRGVLPANVEHLIYAVPNGGQRNTVVAAKLKRQGTRAGVSDLVLPIARGGYFGLYLEFKPSPPHPSRMSKSQKEWAQLVQAEGYVGGLAIGYEAAKELVLEYMSLPPTIPNTQPMPLKSNQFVA